MIKKTFIDRNFTFELDDKDGWKVVSPNNREYSLFEAKSFQGSTSSDIIIVFDYSVDAAEDEPIARQAIVGYTYGAFFGVENYDGAMNRGAIIEDITAYEKKYFNL